MNFFLIIIIIILGIVIVYYGFNYYRKKRFPKTKEDGTRFSQDADKSNIDRTKGEAYLWIRRTSQGPYGTRRI